MECKHFDECGYCFKSGIILNFEGPHDIPMECEFGGDVQKCLDNLITLNKIKILWKTYARIRIEETNPNALKFKDCEEEIKRGDAKLPKQKKYGKPSKDRN